STITLLVSRLVVVYQTTSRSFFGASTSFESALLWDHKCCGLKKRATVNKQKNAICFDFLIGTLLSFLWKLFGDCFFLTSFGRQNIAYPALEGLGKTGLWFGYR